MCACARLYSQSTQSVNPYTETHSQRSIIFYMSLISFLAFALTSATCSLILWERIHLTHSTCSKNTIKFFALVCLYVDGSRRPTIISHSNRQNDSNNFIYLLNELSVFSSLITGQIWYDENIFWLSSRAHESTFPISLFIHVRPCIRRKRTPNFKTWFGPISPICLQVLSFF